MIERNKDCVGLRLVEKGLWLQRVLQILIIGAGDAFERKTMAGRRCNQNGNDQVERSVSDQAEAKGGRAVRETSPPSCNDRIVRPSLDSCRSSSA
ncbi:hypothetical protein MTX20_33715 [Bradyrhizobium sp. ISRA435]|nr:hypothetical protein MTX20_33715 [Bradyrhizobium sp. ISRA435]